MTRHAAPACYPLSPMHPLRTVVLLSFTIGTFASRADPLYADEAARWRVQAQGGQAFAPASQRFAEFSGAAVARDFRLFWHFGGAVELYPILIIHQTREDHETRQTVPAAAAALLLTLTVGPRNAPWNARIDAGSGLFYSQDRVPAQGSYANFFDQGGLWLLHRLDSGRRLRIGYRYVHISNLNVLGDLNPGLTFHALALGFDL